MFPFCCQEAYIRRKLKALTARPRATLLGGKAVGCGFSFPKFRHREEVKTRELTASPPSGTGTRRPAELFGKSLGSSSLESTTGRPQPSYLSSQFRFFFFLETSSSLQTLLQATVLVHNQTWEALMSHQILYCILQSNLFQANKVSSIFLSNSLVVLYCSVESYSTELWFLEDMDDGAAPRWTRRYTLQRTLFGEDKPFVSLQYHYMLEVLHGGEMLVWVDRRSTLRAYDPETYTWTDDRAYHWCS